jgi:transposase
MPWKVTDVVDERTRFVLEYDSGSFTMAELCRIYGIARKTGYLWVERYEVEGLAGLQARRLWGLASSQPDQEWDRGADCATEAGASELGSQEATGSSVGDEL